MRCGRGLRTLNRLTNEDFGDFGLLCRFGRWDIIKCIDAGLLDGVLDHRAAKADEGDTCHYRDKGYPSMEQKLI